MSALFAALMQVAIAGAPVDEPLPEVRVERIATSVLGGFAVANLTTGTTGYFVAEAPAWRAFHGTNAAWNTVNLGLAAAGSVSLARRADETLAQRQARGAKLHRVLAINAGLDVGYMATGATLWAVGSQQNRPELHGAGASLLVQGAFLLAFDLTYRSCHRNALSRAARPVYSSPTTP